MMGHYPSAFVMSTTDSNFGGCDTEDVTLSAGVNHGRSHATISRVALILLGSRNGSLPLMLETSLPVASAARS